MGFLNATLYEGITKNRSVKASIRRLRSEKKTVLASKIRNFNVLHCSRSSLFFNHTLCELTFLCLFSYFQSTGWARLIRSFASNQVEIRTILYTVIRIMYKTSN